MSSERGQGWREEPGPGLVRKAKASVVGKGGQAGKGCGTRKEEAVRKGKHMVVTHGILNGRVVEFGAYNTLAPPVGPTYAASGGLVGKKPVLEQGKTTKTKQKKQQSSK